VNASSNSPNNTIVIGAGIAGLIAAIELHRAGREVLVLEAAPEVGGRVRTTVQDGFRLDHGFQVLFTAYPTLNRYLDHAALELRPFLPAARIVRDGRGTAIVGDALADLSLLLPSLAGGAVPFPDLFRMLRLRQFAMALSIDECFSSQYAAVSTRDFLTARGFSGATINGFFAPFYGGILLDRSLSTRASVLLFTFKMLAEGRTAVPANGMGAIPAQLAAQLPEGSVRCNTRVRSLHTTDARASGVVLDDGTLLPAHDVVLATDLVTAHALTDTVRVALQEPRSILGCTTVYYSASSAVLPGRALWLNARPEAVVSHAVTLTEVAPSYAPVGRHLIAATVLGEAATHDDATLDAAVRRDLGLMAPTPVSEALSHVATWRVPLAQFAQPVLAADASGRRSAHTALPNLWRASEVLHSSSLEGAARGGQQAAHAVLTTRDHT
jgi:phytoene dehydrogenase-like protein